MTTNLTRLSMAVVALASVVLAAGVAVAGPLDHPGYVKSATCSACHGFAGASRSDTMPVLAGMDAAYIKKALQDYASGKRVSPEMEPFAKQALQLGVDDVAGYFASQKKAPTPVTADPAAVARGRTAAATCAGCHGADGKGDPSKQIPDLRGQPPGYLRNQMMLFKADRRSPGDANLKAIKTLMKTVPDQTFADLAAYYSSQR
ncbi:MAG: c-type cytochrome [Candidatus Rokubacteria bacterium]|nr:c-type cytochrome [Candidatus Rokubacteria bacterium]